MSPRTLASRIVHAERAEFVGRHRELLIAETLFEREGGVLLVHGPSGIGKSVLLRELGRRGAGAGWKPAELETAHEHERPLVLVDDFDPAHGPALREALTSLPACAVVVIAGREAFDPGWHEGGWETATCELVLTPFSDAESRTMLARLGLDGDPRVDAILTWADGLPRTLRLGATAALADADWRPGVRSAQMCAYLRRVADEALSGPFGEVFALACITRSVGHAMLIDVLPGVDAAAGLRWLDGCGLDGNEWLRRLFLVELRGRDPELERSLRRRLADHLHARGELALAADLIEDPAVRSGYGWDGSYRVGPAVAGDEALAPDAATRAFFPEHVLVARDRDGRVAGYAIAFAADTACELARRDERLGLWLAHAPADSVVWRDSVNLTGDPASRVQAQLNLAAILGCGVRNPRYAYLPIAGRAGHAFAAAVGARHAPALDFGGIECHILDYGPGGLLGAQRDLIHRELGSDAIDLEAVRNALRNLHVPGASAGPVSRERLEEAAERAFGDTPDEQLLRRVLVRGYFDPAGSHEAAAHELHLSRASYFRRLRAASERVAEWLAVDRR